MREINFEKYNRTLINNYLYIIMDWRENRIISKSLIFFILMSVIDFISIKNGFDKFFMLFVANHIFYPFISLTLVLEFFRLNQNGLFMYPQFKRNRFLFRHKEIIVPQIIAMAYLLPITIFNAQPENLAELLVSIVQYLHSSSITFFYIAIFSRYIHRKIKYKSNLVYEDVKKGNISLGGKSIIILWGQIIATILIFLVLELTTTNDLIHALEKVSFSNILDTDLGLSYSIHTVGSNGLYLLSKVILILIIILISIIINKRYYLNEIFAQNKTLGKISLEDIEICKETSYGYLNAIRSQFSYLSFALFFLIIGPIFYLPFQQFILSLGGGGATEDVLLSVRPKFLITLNYLLSVIILFPSFYFPSLKTNKFKAYINKFLITLTGSLVVLFLLNYFIWIYPDLDQPIIIKIIYSLVTPLPLLSAISLRLGYIEFKDQDRDNYYILTRIHVILNVILLVNLIRPVDFLLLIIIISIIIFNIGLIYYNWKKYSSILSNFLELNSSSSAPEKSYEIHPNESFTDNKYLKPHILSEKELFETFSTQVTLSKQSKFKNKKILFLPKFVKFTYNLTVKQNLILMISEFNLDKTSINNFIQSLDEVNYTRHLSSKVYGIHENILYHILLIFSIISNVEILFIQNIEKYLKKSSIEQLISLINYRDENKLQTCISL